VAVTNITSPDAVHFRVEGVPPAQDAAFRQAATEVQANFDSRHRRERHLSLHLEAERAGGAADDAVIQARQTIERRVNELGVTEPSIAQQGADQLLVQLPGVTDVDRAKGVIGSPGLLELKIVEQGPARRGRAFSSTARCRRHGYRAWNERNGRGCFQHVVLPGSEGCGRDRRDLRNARQTVDENNQPAVGFTLSTEGGASSVK